MDMATEEEIKSSMTQHPVFGIVLVVTGGALLHRCAYRLRLPYTVLMFLYGLILGLIGNWVAKDQRERTYNLIFSGVSDGSPEAILHIFLPILIFEGSFALKTYAFWSVFSYIVLLAGPGLLINVGFLGVALKVMYPAWSWYLASLLGSILSATDPVAVVALLKDLGVDKRLTAIIDGESMMNDGTAIIMFSLLVPAAQYGHVTDEWYVVIFSCLRLTVGAVLYGLLIGWLTKRILRSINDELVQTCASVTLAYIAYFTAETWLHTSGVLTLVFMGTFLSTYMPTLFPGKETSTFGAIWHLLVYLANTVLFAIIGGVLAHEVIPLLTFQRVGNILLLYLICAFSRFVMILLLTPVLSLNPAVKFGVKEAALLTHGGLRGGISAMLSLLVFEIHGIKKEHRVEILVLTSGIVFLTLVFNATTAKKVVAYLGHHTREYNRIQQMELAMRHVRAEGAKRLRAAKIEERFTGADWGKVESSFLTSLKDPFSGIKAIYEEDEGMLNILLMRALKTKIWSVRDKGEISEEAVIILADVISGCIASGTLISTEVIFSQIQYPARLRFLYQRIRKQLPQTDTGFFMTYLNNFTAEWKASVEFDFYSALKGYHKCLVELKELIPSYAPNSRLLEMAITWHANELEAVETKIRAFAEKHPLTECAYTTRAAAAVVADRLRQEAEELHELLGLSQPAAEALEHASSAVKEYVIDHWPHLLEAEKEENVLMRSDLLRDFPMEHLRSFRQSLTERTAHRGEVVSIENCAGVVVRGVLGASGPNGGIGRGPGHCFNLAPAFSQTKPAKFVVLSDEVSMMTIPYTVLTEVYATYPAALAALLRIVGREGLALAAKQFIHPYTQMDIAEVADRLMGKGMAIVAEVDGFTFADEPSMSMSIVVPTIALGSKALLEAISNQTRPQLLYISGAGHHSLLKENVGPFIVPVCVQAKMRWHSGAAFFSAPLFEADGTSNAFGEETILGAIGGSSTIASRNDSVEMIVKRPQNAVIISSPTTLIGVASSPVFPIAEDMRRTVEDAAELLATYDPYLSITPIPYLNTLQIQFLLVLENLMGTLWRHRNSGSSTLDTKGAAKPNVLMSAGVHKELIEVAENTLSFLRTFCLESFTVESIVYARLLWGLEDSSVNSKLLLNQQSATNTSLTEIKEKIKIQSEEHNAFMDRVATWRQQLMDGDISFADLITSMTLMAAQHFKNDHELCVAAMPFMHMPDMRPLVDRASFAPFTKENENDK